MLELPPLSLYIHIPWCVKKCPYCDFNSHEAKHSIPEAEYITALCEDFDADYAQCDNREIHSIFIGGGTPSLFSAAAIEKLLNHIRKHAPICENAEISLEANPGTVEANKFRGYRQIGINRLSLGIQSFDDAQLKNLGRIHDADESRNAIDIAIQAGFDNFNLDIMHGLPGQNTEQAVRDLSTAIGFSPNHISWYQLTIEANTVFYARPPLLPSESVIDELEIAGNSLLEESDYRRYEVSAFSREGMQSQHNLNYWQFGDYLGIGAGAHGKVSKPQQNSIVRTRKQKQPNHYLQSQLNRSASIIEIEKEERPIEFLLNALRTTKGFSSSLFESRTGLPFSTIGKKVEYLVSDGMLQFNGDWITSTEKGYRLLNNLLEEFV